jgi:hypothetical protein
MVSWARQNGTQIHRNEPRYDFRQLEKFFQIFWLLIVPVLCATNRILARRFSRYSL